MLFAVPVPNVARSVARYLVDPRIHLQWQQALRTVVPPLEVIGGYHSHPAGPAFPSPTDVGEAHDPSWVHLIIGAGQVRPRLGAFRIVDGRVDRLSLRWR